MSRWVLAAVFFFLASSLRADSLSDRYSRFGKLIVVGLPTAPFPHPLRADGHLYNNTMYDAADHYRDSSVAVFVPRGFRAGSAVDLVVHFHGWFNNIDSVLSQYRLVEQFCESRVNALLVVPQGPRNAPDSFGGRLEDPDGFRRFVHDVVSVLRSHHIIRNSRVGKILLSGHSGGYHVISFILMRGGMTAHISDVLLFDALYGETEKYVHWMDLFHGKIRAIYTQDGGTKGETEHLMEDLTGWRVPFYSVSDTTENPRLLKRSRFAFLSTNLAHNDVVAKRETYRLFLETSDLARLPKPRVRQR